MTISNALARASFVASVSACLVACSGSSEPSIDNMKQAVVTNAKNRFFGAGYTIEDFTIEKGACVAASGAAGFVCDLRVGRPIGENKAMVFGPWAKGRFFQAGGAWQHEDVR